MSRVYEAFVGDGEPRVFDPLKFEPNYHDYDDLVKFPEPNEVEDELIVDVTASNECEISRDKYLIDLAKEYPAIEYTLKINGTPTFPKGNLQAIKARAKQGKTHVNICLMTALISGKFLAIESLINNSKICYFATEEHISSVANLNKKIHKQCGLDMEQSNEQLRVYSIRDAEVTERVEFIEQEIEHEKPDIVFVDGIRDLLIDFNSIQESYKLINKLMKWSGKYNCAIVNVLHTNKADYNMRGHLGTELLNKSSDVLEVEKKGNNFVVQHSDSRNRETGKWAFCFDDKDLLKEGEIQEKSENSAEKRLVKMEEDFLRVLGKKVLSFTELRDKYMTEAGVAKDTANKHIRRAFDKKIIEKDENEKYKLCVVAESDK